jgi:Tol biopolymer transport system component
VNRRRRSYRPAVKNGIRFFLLTAFVGLALGVSAAAGGTNQTQIVVQGGSGFQTETLSGVLTGSVAVAPGTNAGSYSAAANGSIAYFDNVGGGVWVVNPNGPPVAVDSSPQDSEVAISPDGSKVAFSRVDPTTEASDIYVVNADGSDPTLVASGGGNNYLGSPSFSPDGSTIAYTCTSANNAAGTGIGCGPTAAGTYVGGGVMLMNPDGSDKRVIVGFAFGNLGDSLSWSPDGQSVAVTEISDQGLGPWEVFVYRTDGSDLLNFGDASRQITQDSDDSYSPRFTPDGTQIVFEKVVATQWTFFTIDADGASEQKLSLPTQGRFEVVPPATGGDSPPTVNVGQLLPAPESPVVVASWMSSCHGYLVETAAGAFTACVPGHGRTGFYSNTSIAAASDDAVVYSDLSASPAGPAPGGEGPIWLSRPNTAPVELDASVYDFEPSISADGSHVAFARYDPATGGSDVYTINSDGSKLKLVASGTGTSHVYMSNPTLSPDGRAIAYDCGSIDTSYSENNEFCGPLFDGTFRAGGLMLMNADGSDKREIVNVAGETIAWSPDGQWLATEGRGGEIYAYRTDGSDLFMGNQPSRQITNQTDAQNPAWDPQFSADGSQIMYQTNFGDNGASGAGSYSYVIGRDGSDNHEVFLTPLDVGIGVPGLFVPAAGGGGPSATVAPTQAPVPNVTALGYHLAKAKLAARQLTAKVTRRPYSSRVRRGHVISQLPRARTLAQLTAAQKPVVKLVVSRGRRPHKRR